MRVACWRSYCYSRHPWFHYGNSNPWGKPQSLNVFGIRYGSFKVAVTRVNKNIRRLITSRLRERRKREGRSRKERKLEKKSRARNVRLRESLKHLACTGRKRLQCRLMKYWLLSTVFVCVSLLRAVRSDSNVAFHMITGATFEPGLNKTAAVFSASFQFVPYRTLSWTALTNFRRASQ